MRKKVFAPKPPPCSLDRDCRNGDRRAAEVAERLRHVANNVTSDARHVDVGAAVRHADGNAGRGRRCVRVPIAAGDVPGRCAAAAAAEGLRRRDGDRLWGGRLVNELCRRRHGVDRGRRRQPARGGWRGQRRGVAGGRKGFSSAGGWAWMRLAHRVGQHSEAADVCACVCVCVCARQREAPHVPSRSGRKGSVSSRPPVSALPHPLPPGAPAQRQQRRRRRRQCYSLLT